MLITRAVNSDLLAYTVGLQQENNQVTNPDPGTTAQLTAAVIPDAKLNGIVNMTIAAEVAYCRVERGYYAGDCRNVWLVETKPRSLDLEFKLLQNGHLVRKQLRELHGD